MIAVKSVYTGRILLFFFWLCSLPTYSQTISGILKDNTDNPVESALLTINNTTITKTGITDKNGYYKIEIPAGNYFFEISKQNTTLLLEMITIKDDTIRNIILHEPAGLQKNLEEVTVTTRKKLIERKVDRTVFNVENSISSQGTDALEALSNTPLVKVTDNAISIAGKSSVAVMINDRLLNLQGEDLQNYLKSIRSDDIAKIEVITTPPAKYTAEGQSGLINIILKKNVKLGWNASLQTGGNLYSKSKLNSGRIGSTFNYQNERLSMSFGFNGSNFRRQQNSENTLNYYNGDYWDTKEEVLHKSPLLNPSIKSEYQLNAKSVLGFNYNYSTMNAIKLFQINTYRKVGTSEKQFQSASNDSLQNHYHSGTLFYDLKLDTIGTMLRLSGNFLDAKTDADKWSVTYENDSENTIVNTNYSRYKIYALQADLEKKMFTIDGEFGIKYTAIQNDALLKNYNVINNFPVLNPLLSNDFFYKENNFAAYFSLMKKLSSKWETKVGLRYEYTTLEGTSPNQNVTHSSRYGQFFPTGYLSYKPNSDHSFSLSYSRRINRPNFQNLNPYRKYFSVYEYEEGNPYLKPSFSNSVELNYTLKNNFNVNMYYVRSTDNWDRVIRFVDGVNVERIENFFTQYGYGFEINYTQNKLSWMENTVTLQSNYLEAKSHSEEVIAAAGSFFSECNLTNTFFIKRDKTLSVIVTLDGNTPYRYGNTQYYSYFRSNIGLKGSVLDKKLSYSILLNDVFATTRSRGDEYFTNFLSTYTNRSSNRFFNISVTYKFGNETINGATKKVQFDENNRAQ
ncbi:TonB-dependent receptor domain-containing protein [Flavobacterium cerinum]|uniref:TonB-dependent receptor n=1 Tax=Flavobacterium cerinum TaxID=2502784 RepID=A0ABY5IM39_9FLAO|nr:TonB-dependent receptor [Flavobacterium cerinum]UUC43918.1 TonB-dependent receptor [Flavobacterium cerinum]